MDGTTNGAAKKVRAHPLSTVPQRWVGRDRPLLFVPGALPCQPQPRSTRIRSTHPLANTKPVDGKKLKAGLIAFHPPSALPFLSLHLPSPPHAPNQLQRIRATWTFSCAYLWDQSKCVRQHAATSPEVEQWRTPSLFIPPPSSLTGSEVVDREHGGSLLGMTAIGRV